MSKSIKIFVSHRVDMDCKVLDNPLFIPVRCGAVFDNRKNITMLGDNTGDNISEKRMSFCELTVLYWAWKNQKADYMGLCHYRRYFNFTNKEGLKDIPITIYNAGATVVDYLDNETIDKFGLNNQELIRKQIENYDALVVYPVDFSHTDLKHNYDAMEKFPSYHKIKDVDLVLSIVKEKYPEMYPTAEKYMFGIRYNRLYNCFVLKYELFDKFCNWFFDIVFELDKRLDMTGYNESQFRTPGTIGERLFGIWVLWMQEQNYKVNEIPVLFVNNPEKELNTFITYFNYYRCKLLSKLTFGKNRNHYKDQKVKLKEKVNIIRAYKRRKSNDKK